MAWAIRMPAKDSLERGSTELPTRPVLGGFPFPLPLPLPFALTRAALLPFEIRCDGSSCPAAP